jgi:hypothetical protein
MRAQVRWVAPVIVAIAAIAGSCTEISTNPTTVLAIEFDSLPYPAIVTGDSLRDSLGKVAPLTAKAFNGSGALIPNPAITFLALDSGLTIGAGGFVTAQRRADSVRILASVPGLQSNVLALRIARRPDSVFATTALFDTIHYVVPDVPSTNSSPALSLALTTLDTAGGIKGTQGWLVSYQVLFHGKALAVTDTSVASLWTPASRPALLDTTASDGTATRTLRIYPAGLPTTAESVTVVASVRYRGAPVRGSPVTFSIQIRPK